MKDRQRMVFQANLAYSKEEITVSGNGISKEDRDSLIEIIESENKLAVTEFRYGEDAEPNEVSIPEGTASVVLEPATFFLSRDGGGIKTIKGKFPIDKTNRDNMKAGLLGVNIGGLAVTGVNMQVGNL